MHVLPTDDGIRPAGPPDRCYYCNRVKGTHANECVCVTRTIVLRMQVEYVVEVPRSWDSARVESHRNDSSFCKSNDLLRLPGCICRVADICYLREATAEDHERYGYSA